MNNIYMYKGKDVTLLFIMKLTEVCKCISRLTGIQFKNVVPGYYSSNTYEMMKDTENGLWLESVEYIANQYMEENNY